MPTQFLIELTGYTDTAASAVHAFCTGTGRDDLPQGRGYCPLPTDAAPAAWYDDRIINPGSIVRQLFAAGSSGVRANPRAEVSYGLAELDNLDGGLDPVFDGTEGVSFRERQARTLAIDHGAAYSSATVLLRAAISQPALSIDKVTVGLKGRLYELDTPHQTVLFAGSNSLPNGLEGVDDLKGKPKPLIYGKVFNFSPPCVNTSRLIYQVSARALQSVDAVRDGGVVLTAGAAYSSQSDMETNAPAASQYRVWLAGSAAYIRLGSSLVYGLAVDATGDTAGNSTCAQLLKRLALDRGWASGDISSSDVTALDALTTAVCGTVVADSRTTLAVMDEIARSAGVSYFDDRLGVLRMLRFDDVGTGTGNELVLAPWNVEAVEQLPTGEDVPTTTIQLRYARYWSQQSLAELDLVNVTEAFKADLAQEWRVATASTTPSPNPHKRVLQAERDTALAYKADADAEATRLLALTSVPRRTHLLRGVSLDATELAQLELGGLIELRWGRYGFSTETGTLRRVIGITTSLRTGLSDITVWGT